MTQTKKTQSPVPAASSRVPKLPGAGESPQRRLLPAVAVVSINKMPRTSSQQRAREGLLSLDDDALRSVLSLLSVADGRRGAGVTCKALRQAVASNQLARARATAPYVLRGNTHGVVHSLATSFGTAQWHKRSCIDQIDSSRCMLSTPPENLDIRIERLGKGEPGDERDTCFRSSIVDPHENILTTMECRVAPGSFVEYKLPFQLRISHFRLGYGACSANLFKCFVFEAYDRNRLAWHTLYESNGVGPWADIDDFYSGPRSQGRAETKYFDVDAFTSTRFRIRLTQRDYAMHFHCMHIRAFELFGTVLPPWQV